MASSSSSSSSPSNPASDSPQTASSPEAIGAEKAYERYLPQALELEAAEVIIYPGRIELAYRNATEGAEAVLEEKDRLQAELPRDVYKQVRSLPSLASATMFAVRQANRSVYADSTAGPVILPLRQRSGKVRALLLSSAQVLARKGLVPQTDVDHIARGRGLWDQASDCIDLVALFRKHETAIRGKSPVTEHDLQEAAEVGNALLQLLHPKDLRRTPPVLTPNEQVDIRDRFWTLLCQRYDLLWRAGAWLWGRDVQQRVPALLGRAVVIRKPKPQVPGTQAGSGAVSTSGTSSTSGAAPAAAGATPPVATASSTGQAAAAPKGRRSKKGAPAATVSGQTPAAVPPVAPAPAAPAPATSPAPAPSPAPAAPAASPSAQTPAAPAAVSPPAGSPPPAGSGPSGSTP